MSTTADILMYHSISNQGGATSISAPVFQVQMQAIATAGIRVISLDEWLANLRGDLSLQTHCIILTFDDGYLDFFQEAWPVIQANGWPVTVYLPTKYIGQRELWHGHATPPRPLMSWQQIKQLADQGVTFGGHSHSHPDLSSLKPTQIRSELTKCQDGINAHTGQKPTHFAPPYGRANAAVQAEIKALFQSSCGTRLARACASDDPFDLPRIEMYYYQTAAIWERHLAGLGMPYLAVRKAMRAVRAGLTPSKTVG